MIIHYPKPVYGILLLTLLAGAMACHNTARQEDSRDAATDRNAAVFGNTDSLKKAAFVVNAVASARDVIQLSALAAGRGDHAAVQAMAAQLKAHQEALLERYTTYAAQNNIHVPEQPTKDGRRDYTRLAGMKSGLFDKAWCELLIQKYRKLISDGETAARVLPDDSLRKLVLEELPAQRQDDDKLMQYHHQL